MATVLDSKASPLVNTVNLNVRKMVPPEDRPTFELLPKASANPQIPEVGGGPSLSPAAMPSTPNQPSPGAGPQPAATLPSSPSPQVPAPTTGAGMLGRLGGQQPVQPRSPGGMIPRATPGYGQTTQSVGPGGKMVTNPVPPPKIRDAAPGTPSGGSWQDAWNNLLKGNLAGAWGDLPGMGKGIMGAGGIGILLLLLSRLFGKRGEESYSEDEIQRARDVYDRLTEFEKVSMYGSVMACQDEIEKMACSMAKRYSRTYKPGNKKASSTREFVKAKRYSRTHKPGTGKGRLGQFEGGNRFQGAKTAAEFGKLAAQKEGTWVTRNGKRVHIKHRKKRKKKADLSSSDLGLNMSSVGGGLADYLAPQSWGGTRAGRAAAMARAMGEEPGMNIEHPVISELLGMTGGAVGGGIAGGAGGAGLGYLADMYQNRDNTEFGGSLGAGIGTATGALLAPLILRYLRRRRMGGIGQRWDVAAEKGESPDVPIPRFNMAATALAPLRGPHRAGQMDVVQATRDNKPVQGKDLRHVGYAGQYLGSLGALIRLLQGYGQNLGAHEEANKLRRDQSAEEMKPELAAKAAAFGAKMARDMPSFTDQDRPAKTKEIYRALKRDHPEMPAGMKARIASRQGKPGKQHQGPPYKGPLSG